MKIPAFRKLALSLFLAVAGLLSFAPSASAQSCSISSTFTAVNTGSTVCFTNKGNSNRVTLTGTWVGTVQLQVSRDGGTTWFVDSSYSGNVNYNTDAAAQDLRYKWYITAYTSGTVSYTINDITFTQGKLKWPVVETGSVAYSSFGTSTTAAATTSVYVSDVWLHVPFRATGIGVLVGAATSATQIVMLFDSAGNLVANSATAGTAPTGAAASTFVEVPFTSTVNLAAGNYYLGWQTSTTAGTCRMIAASTFVHVRTSLLTGNAYGTVLAAFAPPTTFTALTGCIAYIY